MRLHFTAWGHGYRALPAYAITDNDTNSHEWPYDIAGAIARKNQLSVLTLRPDEQTDGRAQYQTSLGDKHGWVQAEVWFLIENPLVKRKEG